MTDQPGPLPRVAVTVPCRGTKAMATELHWVGEESQLRLVREPDNPYDANAVRIEGMRPAGWESDVDHWTLLGYVPREVAVRLAQNLDGGEEWLARVYMVLEYRGEASGLRVQLYPEGTEHLPDQWKRDREHERRRQRQREDWGPYDGYGY